MMSESDLNSIIFMKVGRHAGEDFEKIIERKRAEYQAAGLIFWGYGGGTMHPIQRVQPFVQTNLQRGNKITLVMQVIDSRHPDTDVFATDYSRDGIKWQPIPEGVRVRGSRYALVLDEVQQEDIDIDLGQYAVGAGPSSGTHGSGYIQGRVDKGCLEKSRGAEAEGDSRIVHTVWAAHLKEPYAVLLRSA